MIRYDEESSRPFSRRLQVWKAFILANALMAIGTLPFLLGLTFSLMHRSIGMMVLSCAVGGCFLGPVLSGLVDCILRRLRNCQDDWWYSYRRAWKQNWKASMLPGIVLCLFCGFLIYMGILMYWSIGSLSGRTIAAFFCSMVFASILFHIYWPQLVLFDQTNAMNLRNCMHFIPMHMFRCLGAALVEAGGWVLAVLMLPWSALVLPFFGWIILYSSIKLLYPAIEEAFGVKDLISANFPEQLMP